MTTGAQFLLSWWFRKQPIFWLPEGWVPYPVAWLLSFPSAPIGKHNQANVATVADIVHFKAL